MSKSKSKAEAPKQVFESYTVMLDGQPVVVKAQSLEAAITKARRQVQVEEPQPDTTEVGDGN